MGHLKRYAMPKSWKIGRKEKVWVIKPLPGPHAQRNSIPLQVILRDIFHYAGSAREAKKILNSEKVLVDKKPRKSPGYPVGVMDIIEIPEAKKYFRTMVNKGGFFFEEIKPEDAGRKLCRIENKKTIKGGIIQLNLHDGRNVLIKDTKTYKPGDSILISLPEQKILKHYKLQKDENAFIIAGKNIGLQGKINEVKERKTLLEKSTVALDVAGKLIETLKNYVIVGNFVSKSGEKPKQQKSAKPEKEKKPEIKTKEVEQKPKKSEGAKK